MILQPLTPTHAARLLIRAARSVGTLCALTPPQLKALEVLKAAKSRGEDWAQLVTLEFDPDQPRDDQGQWTDGGGGGVGPQISSVEVEARLEAESARGIQAVESHLQDAVINAEYSGVKGEEATQEWNDLSSVAQDASYDKWLSDNPFDDVDTSDLDDEVTKELRQNNDEIVKVAEKDTLLALRDEFTDSDPTLDPSFNLHRRLDPQTIEVGDDDGDGSDIDLDALRFTSGEKLEPIEQLTVGRTWNKAYEKAFAQAESDAFESDDYYERRNELESEAQNNAWSNLSDSEKLKYAQDNDDIQEVSPGLPSNWTLDPAENITDYGRTRAIGRELITLRTEQLLEERSIDTTTSRQLSKVWDDWKGSSTSPGGKALQLATAQELGGHHQFTADDIKTLSSQGYGDEKITELRAYVRANWETSQFLLSKTGQNEITAYRGLMLPGSVVNGVSTSTQSGYTKLPEISISRNGAASATFSAKVANEWNGIDVGRIDNPTRVVLRFKVPRTAVLSLPVFGQNVHDEKEVVLAGTRGHWKWDAWLNKAPEPNHVAMQ